MDGPIVSRRDTFTIDMEQNISAVTVPELLIATH